MIAIGRINGVRGSRLAELRVQLRHALSGPLQRALSGPHEQVTSQSAIARPSTVRVPLVEATQRRSSRKWSSTPRMYCWARWSELAASSRRDGAASGSTLHQRGSRVGLRFVPRVPASILPSSSCGQSNTKDSRKDPIARRETSRPRFASRRVVIHSAWHAQEERFKDDAKRLVRWCYRDFLTTHSIDRAGAVVLFGPRPSGQAGSLRVPVHPR